MVRTRIAPSPTGEDIHIGNLYTALINFAVAKKHNGKFIVRIEDTDRTRLVIGSEEKILSSLIAFKLIYDEGPDKEGEFGPYRQSERLDIYKKYSHELLKKKAAYYCFCTKERLVELREKQTKQKQIPRYDKYCLNNVKDSEERIKNNEPYVIRLNVSPDKKIYFDDAIRGRIEFDSNQIDDQILIKSDGYPTYHLAVVVDDYLMKITHVIRAEDWISSTPKHVILYESLNWQTPIIAHVPLLRNLDHSKLSKRKNPVWASWYLEQGFLPEAILNYLALMGWSHPDQKEIFDLEEFIQVFELSDMQTVGPVFDIKKLEWMNGVYIRKLPISNLKSQISNYYNNTLDEKTVEKTLPLVQERIHKLSDYLPLCEFFFKEPSKYEIDLSTKKNMFDKIAEALISVSVWEGDTIGEKMQQVATELKIKNNDFFMNLRVAITGKKISPPLNESMEILGKEKVLKRIENLQNE